MTFMRSKAGVKKCELLTIGHQHPGRSRDPHPSSSPAVWTKTEVKPQGTVVRKTIPDVEKHGKCRFACYQGAKA